MRESCLMPLDGYPSPVLLYPCRYADVSPVVLVFLSDVTLLFEGAQSVVSVIALVTSPEVTLLFEGSQSSCLSSTGVSPDVMLLSQGGQSAVVPGIAPASPPADGVLLFDSKSVTST